MADMELVFPSYAQHERMAAALEAIALNGGSGSATALDAACQSVLDGKNTTRVFWAYYPRAVAAGEIAQSRYACYCNLYELLRQKERSANGASPSARNLV